MLHQSLEQGGSEFLSPEGDRVSLGVFWELQNSLSKKRSLIFELAAQSPIPRLDRNMLRQLRLVDGIEQPRLTYKTSASFPYNRGNPTGRTSHLLVEEVSRRHLLRTETRILGDSTFLDMPALPRVDTELEDTAALVTEEYTRESLDEFVRHIEGRVASMEQYLAESELVSTVRREIHSLRHLSPVREESQRVIQVSPPPPDYVGQRGQFTLPHLQQMVTDYTERYEFILPHMANVAGLESIEFETSKGFISRAFARSRSTGARVLVADYGFGVSQCLPILVQGVIMPRYTSMMVEEPEAQLHPTAQLELGSFFTDLWRERKVGSIIETHSANILLRIRRRIARGDLPNTDVSVAFFTFDEDNGNMPVIKNLDINEDGSMQPGLPMEFFGADVIEGLSLGARA